MQIVRTLFICILIIQLNVTGTNCCCCCWWSTTPKKTVDFPKLACENFYEYACGNYSLENTDPNYSEITQKLDYEMNKRLLKQLRRTFNLPRYIFRNQTYYDKMGMYWESCNKESQRNLKKYFEELKPGHNLSWPLLNVREQWLGSDEKFDFWSLLGELQSHGLTNVIVNPQIVRNKDNSLNIWLAPAAINEDNALPDNTTLQVLLGALGITQAEYLIEQLTATNLKWQEILAQQTDSNEIEEFTYEDLDPNLQLFFKNLLGSDIENLSLVVVENSKYFEFLSHKTWTAEELEQLCNYLMIKFLFYLAVDSTTEFTAMACVKDLRNKFDLAVNYYYYNHFLRFTDKRQLIDVFTMIAKISLVMAEYFEENHLNLSNEQVQELKHKLLHIDVNIGNLPKGFHYYKIEAFYRDIPNLDRNNYYKNHLLLLKHRFRNTLLYNQNQTHFVVTDNRLGSLSSPFYAAQQNMIVIPYGCLQPPLYNYLQMPLEKFSLFGFVLAHELAHAFDTTGLNYDHLGFPLTNTSSIMDHVNFTKSLDCMQQQEPTADIDERIADLFGVRVAYRTYLSYYAEEGEIWRDEFFVHFAQFFCGKSNLKFIDHDSDAIRLQQVVKNFHSFARTFGCAKGKAMNPKDKCRLY